MFFIFLFFFADITNGFVCETCVTGQYQDELGSDANGGNTVCKYCASGMFGVLNGCQECDTGQCKVLLFFETTLKLFSFFIP